MNTTYTLKWTCPKCGVDCQNNYDVIQEGRSLMICVCGESSNMNVKRIDSETFIGKHMSITATQILEMLSKATDLDINYSVTYNTLFDSHFIKFRINWYEDRSGRKHTTYETLIITKKNESNSNLGDWDFYDFMSVLDKKLEEKNQEKIKEQQRQQVLAKLTPEERELLGV